MEQEGYWPEGYWPGVYWTEGYFPDGEAGEAMDDAGAGWWYVPELRESMGFKDSPLPTVHIPPVEGVIHASVPLLRLSARGRVLHPEPALKTQIMPEVREQPAHPVKGIGRVRLPLFSTIGAGRADLYKGEGEADIFTPAVIGAGAVGVAGKGEMPFGLNLWVEAKADHLVCTEEEFLALVAAAWEGFDRTDGVTEEELVTLVAIAVKQIWGEAHS